MVRNTITLILIGVFLIVCLVGAINLLAPQTAADAEAVSAANQLYNMGNYTEAAQIYEQLVAQGVKDSTVFYNLGNTYYRQGDLGRAIVNYQRAARLAPRDTDIKANLELARGQAVDLLPKEATGPVTSLANMTGNWLTLNETAVLALSIWFVFGLLMLIWRQLRPGSPRTGVQYAMIVALLLVIVTGLSLASRVYVEQTQPGGVVVADAVAVSGQPGEQHATDFSLHSGTEVHIVATDGDWGRLDLPDDSMEVWIPLKAVEMIDGGSR
jgi:hypothetical protein